MLNETNEVYTKKLSHSNLVLQYYEIQLKSVKFKDISCLIQKIKFVYIKPLAGVG